MEEIKKKIEELNQGLEGLKEALKVKEKKDQIQELQTKMAAEDFWQDQKQASRVIEKLKDLKSSTEGLDTLNIKLEELRELFSLSDPSLEADILQELNKLNESYEKLKLKVLFSGKFDERGIIAEINSGAGGTEACDWANMLFRMYFRWALDKGFEVKVLKEERGEEVGIKNITFFVEGKYAYGLLKSERGVHRLVRISPFDANKRRHTSFASVDILPQIKEDIDIEIKPEELRIETFRASGHGGQHVNVTDSAVRITHILSGIVVSCQSERSQYQNKQNALRVLEAKLYEFRCQEKQSQLDKISDQKQKIEWGSQIRSYVLYPYLLVKDHRTKLETHDAKAVLDGKIDDFIYAYLRNPKCEDAKKNNS